MSAFSTWVARIAVVVSIVVGLGATGAVAASTAVSVVSGTLKIEVLDDPIFHIDDLWMRVPSDTEFHRWLSEGLDQRVDVQVTTDPAGFADQPHMRILTGTLIHQTAPAPTAVTTDVMGKLPRGDSPMVHILFLQDPLSGSLGPITFQTTDRDMAAKFVPYDGRRIGIVIRIE